MKNGMGWVMIDNHQCECHIWNLHEISNVLSIMKRWRCKIFFMGYIQATMDRSSCGTKYGLNFLNILSRGVGVEGTRGGGVNVSRLGAAGFILLHHFEGQDKPYRCLCQHCTAEVGVHQGYRYLSKGSFPFHV